jgi:hypothetical protein
LLNQNCATREATVEEPASEESIESEAVEQNSAILIVQVVWGGYSFNASPQEAAKQFVADLYEHLSRGGNVSVHAAEPGGREYVLEVTARR